MILSKRTCHVMIDSDYKFKSKGDLKLSLVLDLPRDSQTTPSQTGTDQTSKAAACAMTVWLIYNDLVGALGWC